MKKSIEHLMAKKGHEMPEHEKNAKMSVLHHMKQIAEEAMKGHMDHGMKKVSVMANDKQGLAEGLDKAKQIIGHPESIPGDPLAEGSPMEMEHSGAPTHDNHNVEGSPEEEASESPEEASMEGDDMSHDEIDAKIQHLMALKHKKMGK